MINLFLLMILFLTVIIICIKFAKWTNWATYYPTVLFAVVCSFVYSLVYYSEPFWSFTKFISPTINNIIFTLVLAPLTLALFLSYRPKRCYKLVFYILGWAVLYTVAEGFIYALGYLEYSERWNIFYSFYFNILLFSLVTSHLKKPRLTWVLTVILALVFVKLFPIQIFV